MILAIIAIILSLILVIGIHELGHAIVARWCHVSIKAIAIGFGRPLFHWQDRKGRDWIWGVWPVGGYVHLLNTRHTAVSAQHHPHCFDKKPIWIRVVILLAGAGANMLMAWLALTLVFCLGYPQTVPIIARVLPNSLAEQAHFKQGDRLSTIASQPTPSWQKVGMQLLENLGHAATGVTVCDARQTCRQLTLNLQQWQTTKPTQSLLTKIGIEPDNHKQYQQQVSGIPVLAAMKQAWITITELLTFYVITLKQLITGAIPFLFLLGPFGLLITMIDSFLQGLVVFLSFIAHLSLAVALVNLLPIPSLDGGSIVYTLIEKLRGKPMSIAFELLLHRLVFIGLCVFFINLLLNDLQRYFG
ncbi:MAG: peptidase [Legionella sp.]|nr:MAG: peptidase [Legionella sp.]